jgi:glucosamine kinase
MFIIADSGSTKCDWTIVKPDGSTFVVHTMGFNPFYHSSEFIANELKKDFVNHVSINEIKKVIYYGTGIHDKFRAEIVMEGLRMVLPNTPDIIVEHDLLASARATCGDSAGIACIIGTGSNTCLYDGVKITDNVSNLGFLAGDEGSGAHIGKKLIQAYFYRELPEEIAKDFEMQYPEGKTAIKNKIYEGAPNVYLASFTRFLAAHKGNYFVQKLVGEAFDELINRHVRKYKGHNEVPIHFVGSIAHYFQDILRICLVEKGLTLGKVIQRPIDALVEYHIKKEYPDYKGLEIR